MKKLNRRDFLKLSGKIAAVATVGFTAPGLILKAAQAIETSTAQLLEASSNIHITTPDGYFSTSAPLLQVGDKIRITGPMREYFTVTNISNSVITIS